MALIDPTERITLADADRLGVAALIQEAETRHERIVARNNRPVAAVVSMERLNQLEQLKDDLRDASLAMARALTTGPDRHSLDEVLVQFGYTRDELRESTE